MAPSRLYLNQNQDCFGRQHCPCKGWPEGVMPTPAPGLKVQAFAQGLQHPRWLYVLPNGDVLVAETDAPPKPEDKRD